MIAGKRPREGSDELQCASLSPLRSVVSSLYSQSSEESQDASGVSEVVRLSRKDNNIADLCLFLAKALCRLGSADALLSLLEHVHQAGPSQCFYALARIGAEEEFMEAMIATQMKTVELRALLLRAVIYFLSGAEGVAVMRHSVIAFLLSYCDLNGCNGDTDVVEKKTVSPSPAPHWSTPRKREITKTTDIPAKLEALLPKDPTDCLGSCTTSHRHCLISLQYLLQAALHQNGKGADHVTNIYQLIGEAGGISRLSDVLLSLHSQRLNEEGLLHAALSLLEVLTASPATKQFVEQLRPCADILASLLSDCNDSDILRASEVFILRAFTNVTAVNPSPVGEASARLFGAYTRRFLLGASMDTDCLPYVLCCGINVLKVERTAESESLPYSSEMLAEGDTTFLMGIIGRLFELYDSSATEKIVIAGYFALFIGILSLVPMKERSLRIAIITALKKLRAAQLQGPSAEKPMMVIAAIIQEFLLFQSKAETLCQEAFIEITEIIDGIVAANTISLLDA